VYGTFMSVNTCVFVISMVRKIVIAFLKKYFLLLSGGTISIKFEGLAPTSPSLSILESLLL